ncbi:YdcF family protein [Clostridium massiliamazoniense]|uniref:YdcF family protein n=1 Tax=Clostridium massiliamazoniense TaxID=1347366 RepID=UPI0006D7AC0F|nr:YdcF family protein [Clostridium massiliamazoniense]
MKNFKGIFFGVLSFCSFIYFLVMKMVVQEFSFNYVFLVLAICSLCYSIALFKFSNNTIFKRINRFINFFIVLVIAVIIIDGSIIGIFAMKKNKNKSDYIIVLGAGLLNGDQISATLKNRLDTTLEYINNHDRNETIVVSGGKGNDERISEAEAMKRYLVSHGIKENRILMEDKSTSTFENFKFSKSIIEEHSQKEVKDISIKIITNGFHCFRSSFLSKRVGFGQSEVYSAKTPWYLIPAYYSREFIAIGKSAIVDK